MSSTEPSVSHAAPALGEPAVTMRGITKRFPGVLANDQVDFEARVGEVHALLGRERRRQEHAVEHPHRPVPRRRGRARALRASRPSSSRRAMRSTPGSGWCTSTSGSSSRSPSPRTSSSAITATSAGRSGSTRARSSSGSPSSESATGSPSSRAREIWQLSVGEQQRVEILKALYREARVLILDEPTAVLTPQEAEGLFVTLRSMAAEGRTIIFISHKLHEVTAVADRVTVLRGGRSIGTVDTAGATSQSLAALMVGRDVDVTRRPEGESAIGEVILEVDGLSAAGDRGEEALRSVSLSVRAGEVLGIAGVAGNGQRELAEAVTGMRPLTAGAVRVGGDALRTGDPRAAITAGIAHVPEDRLHTGVAPSLSIASNIALKSYRTDAAGPFLRLGRIRDRARRDDPALRRQGTGPADAGPPALGRQPAEGRARARVLERAARARRRGADPGSRRRRDRDRARLSAGGRGAAGRGAPDQRGPRRGADPGRPDRRHVRGRDRRRGRRTQRDRRGARAADGGGARRAGSPRGDA